MTEDDWLVRAAKRALWLEDDTRYPDACGLEMAVKNMVNSMRAGARGLLAICCALPLGGACAADAIDTSRLARGLEFRYEVLNNPAVGIGQALQDECKRSGADWASCSTVRLRLENHSPVEIPADSRDWAIFFHSLRRIFAVTNTDGYEIEHLNGDLHRLTPTDRFAGLDAGAAADIDLLAEYWWLYRTDFLPRAYIVGGDGEPHLLANTDTEDISAFSRPITANHPANWKRAVGDNNTLQTAATRYETYSSVQRLPLAQVNAMILPTPRDLRVGAGVADLSQGVSWRVTGLSPDSSGAIMQRLRAMGVRFTKRSRRSFTLRGSVDRAHVARLGAAYRQSGSYELRVEGGGARIVGYDETGLFYGLQSFAALVPADFRRNPVVAKVAVRDSPRYGFRGLHLDVARNFHGQEAVLDILDQMANYKLNRFHFHLSDDEGWRLRIPGLPELTSVGARRCHDLSERTCLLPQLGSGPRADNSGSGYFTVEDYIRIVRYANARHIEVIPEFDMPAHARAAVMAMEARHGTYLARGDMEEAERYRLADPEDTSNYTSIQFYDDSYLNPCRESTYDFIDKVVAEVSWMHRVAGQPLRIWHAGGDEATNIFLGPGFEDVNAPNPAPWRGSVDLAGQDRPWAKSPACREVARAQGITLDRVDAYFLERVSAIVAKHAIEGVAAWQDGVEDVEDAHELATAKGWVNEWDTLFWGGNAAANELLARDFNVVQSHPDFLYFDFPYEVDPAERGLYWAARATDTRKVFSFAPQNLPQNAAIHVDRNGNPYTDASEGDAYRNGGYAGMQGQIWSEVIRTSEQLEYMTYPRLLALAERAWRKAEWELPYVEGTAYGEGARTLGGRAREALADDWEEFANLLGQKELAKLDAAGVRYRVPIPGAKTDEGGLLVNVLFPGLQAEYRDEGGSWRLYRPGTKPAGATAVRGLSADGRRRGRAVPVPGSVPSSDATLSALALSAGTLAFASETSAYEVAVPYEAASVRVTPTVSDPGATVAVNGAAVASGTPSAAVALAVGETVIDIVVTAEDGTTRTYRMEVTRAGAALALFPDAASLVRYGFVRLINESDRAGEVQIRAFDDTGEEYGPLTLAIGAGEAVHFNSYDLESGNAAKGLSGATGAPREGRWWRLGFESDLAIRVLGYIRTPGAEGFPNAMHDTAPKSDDGGSEDHIYEVAFFNPASNARQASLLRLVNRSEAAAAVTITGRDDAGEAGTGEVRLRIPARAARTLSAPALEDGDEALEGALGDGAGKWRLQVKSDRPLAVMSLMRSLEGHLTNLSTAPEGTGPDGAHRLWLLPAASRALWGFVRIVNETDVAGTVRVRAVDDAGEEYGPLTLAIGAGEAVQLDSDDLESGNAAKGLSGATGAPRAGRWWRLAFETDPEDLEVRVLGYLRLRGAEGFPNAMHATAPSSGEGVYEVAFFNPASNTRQASVLRLVNRSEAAAAVTITGRDDTGAAGEGEVRLRIPAGAARMLGASELETGADDFEGALGDGAGKWRLRVRSDRPLAVMSLMRSLEGHLTNLSTAPPASR